MVGGTSTGKTEVRMGVNARVEDVTPAKAEKWLEKMAPNRHLRENVVMRHALSMEKGEWRLDGQAVKFDKNGLLIDGQHRLKAVELSGVTVPMLVVRGLEPDSMVTMDTGLKRTLADVLSLKGETAPVLLAATLVNTLQTRTAIETGKWPNRGGSINPAIIYPTNDWCLQLLESEPGIREAVKVSQTLLKKSGVSVFPKVIATSLHILGEIDVDDSDAFFYSLNKGTNLGEYDAIYKFRLRFAVNNPDRPNTARDQQAYLFKTWNFWRKGTSVQQLSVKFGGARPESFPVPK